MMVSFWHILSIFSYAPVSGCLGIEISHCGKVVIIHPLQVDVPALEVIPRPQAVSLGNGCFIRLDVLRFIQRVMRMTLPDQVWNYLELEDKDESARTYVHLLCEYFVYIYICQHTLNI